MKKIGKKQLIIIISVLIGIVGVIFINNISLAAKIAFTEPKPTQEDYDILKSYALQVAKGEKIAENEELEVVKNIEEEFLKIKIETPSMYGIQSRFPVSITKNYEIKNGTIIYEAVIDYENATFSEYTLISSKVAFIFAYIIIFIMITIISYFALYTLPNQYKKKISKIKE